MDECELRRMMYTAQLPGMGTVVIRYPRGKGVKRDDWHCEFEAIPIGKARQISDGSLIPHVPVAQSTAEIKWDKMEFKAYKASAKKCSGLVYKPGDKDVSIVTR